MFTSQDNAGLGSLLHRKGPSVWQQFRQDPVIFLAKWLYNYQKAPSIQPLAAPITVVCISDTHNGRPQVPDGEILIHAGDATQSGTLKEFQATIDWMHSLPHRYKILIAGNHDMLLDSTLDNRPNSGGAVVRTAINWRSIIYLEKSTTVLRCSGGRQVQIYGNPMTPKHGNWAFQYERRADVWRDVIPSGTDILVTHGPPLAHLDISGWGCKHLLDAVWKVKPRLHVFGHLHDGHGMKLVSWNDCQKRYEEIIQTRGGIWQLLKLCYATLFSRIRPESTDTTLMVNAAVAAGLRDEVLRKPIVVQI